MHTSSKKVADARRNVGIAYRVLVCAEVVMIGAGRYRAGEFVNDSHVLALCGPGVPL